MSRRSASSIRSLVPALVTLFVACGPEVGGEVGSVSQPITSAENPVDVSDEITSVSGGATSFFDPDPRIEVRINKDGKAISEKLLPDLLAGTLTFPDQDIAGGFLPAPGPIFALEQCHTIDGRTWDLTMKNIRVTPALDSNDIALHFAADKQVEADLDLDDFVMTFDLEFLSEHDDNWYCNIFGTDYRATTGVTVTGLTGTLAATVDVPTAGSVKLASIDELDVEAGTVTLTSDFLNAIAPYGLALYDLFGSGCGATINQCVDLQTKDYLKDSDLKVELKKAINDALGPIAKVDTSFNVGNAKIDTTAVLTAVTTSESKDRIRSQWDVDFSTNRADASCAEGLRRASYLAPANTQTTNDFDVLIPYKKITDLLYTVGKTGDLCAPFFWSGATWEVHPAGAFRIDPVFLNSFKLSVPVEIEGQLTPFATGFVSATLELTAALEPKCSGMVLRFTGVNFANATGSAQVTVAGQVKTLSAKTFINTYKATAEAQILALLQPPQVIAPGTFDIPGTGYAIQGGQLTWGQSEVTFGFDVVSGACVP